MSNLPSNSLQEGEHNLQELKTKSPAWSSKGYHMYASGVCCRTGVALPRGFPGQVLG